MSAPLKTLVALAAAAACALAQGCAGRSAASQSTQAAGATAPSSAITAATPTPNAATPTPTPSTPRFSARERGADAFEPFIDMSGGRRFESRKVGRKPVRADLDFGADYPVLLGDEGRAAREFNRQAREFVMEDVEPYLQDRSDARKKWSEGVDMEHHVSHKVVFASDEVVSVFFYITGYTAPAAHGYHFPVTFNFDLKAGRELELAHLFKPRSDYLRTIARLCAEELERQYAQGHIDRGGYGPGEGVKPKAENFKSWVITRDGLVFVFEEYQVTSYAGGEPKVLIPFDSLQGIINPRGALARLAAHE